jgi:hypothetical protein
MCCTEGIQQSNTGECGIESKERTGTYQPCASPMALPTELVMLPAIPASCACNHQYTQGAVEVMD